MQVSFGAFDGQKVKTISGVLALACGDITKSKAWKDLDKVMKGALGRAAKSADFKGEEGETLEILAPHGLAASRVIALGLGDQTALGCEKAGGLLAGKLKGAGEAAATVIAPGGKGEQIIGAHLAYGVVLGNYSFDLYRSKNPKKDKPTLVKLSLKMDNHAAARRLYATLDAIAQGVKSARDFVNEPANVLYPESYAKRLKKLSKLGLKVNVLGEPEMKKLKMGSLLGVGQGSVRKSQLVIMEWRGAKNARSAPIAFVGKGVTFDTGGISLKPPAGMEEMTMDMGGSAAVAGVMEALARRKAKVNAVGVVGLVENMPGANAQRPGDVVYAMDGQSIEVINTDAEGRLVLADALLYTQKKLKPRAMINLATLTGAIIVALDHEYAGVFPNDDGLKDQLIAAGIAEDEKLWPFPMDKYYDKKLKSRVADMANVGGRGAGSITAAQFLKRFVADDLPWAHLDIAGTAYIKAGKPTVPKYGTGFGVRLLNRLVADYYED